MSALSIRASRSRSTGICFSLQSETLLHNAFKFTEQQSEVLLHAHAAADRILIDVEDQCGGLPPGDAEKMFLPSAPDSTEKSGLGLGLSICRRSVEANSGVLSVRNPARHRVRIHDRVAPARHRAADLSSTCREVVTCVLDRACAGGRATRQAAFHRPV
jgi:hypothetical protein